MKNTTAPWRCFSRVRWLAGHVLSGVCVVSTALLANTLLVPTAFAYIDPGTGTMILQAAGALIASALFYFRNIRYWIAAKFGLTRNPRPDADGASGENPANRCGDGD
jgi:hypothetical protein